MGGCGRTVEVSRGLEVIGAVDVVPHLQLQLGASEHLLHGVPCDGGLLQDDHRLLLVQLGTEEVHLKGYFIDLH